MTLMTSLPDVPRMPDPGLYELLQAMRRQIVDLTKLAAAAGAGGASEAVSGARDPPSLVLDYGGVGDGATNNDQAFIAYDEDDSAKDVYIQAGQFLTTATKNLFNRSMHGRGQIVLTDLTGLPADYGYVAVKPPVFAQQGETGWFMGDQWFTDGGEWKVIGPNVRTYDVDARYFESNLIPHHAWLDIESGSSSAQAYIPGGVTPGNSVTLTPSPAPQEWVGKTVQIRQNFGGPVLATLVVASVAANVVTFTTSHSVTAPWNPAGGSAPNLSFAPRTWGGHTYVRVRHRGGGDGYGHIVRMNIEYQPKRPELVHTFNGATGGQYGGDINFVTVTFTLSSPASTGSATISVTPAPPATIVGKRINIKPWSGGAAPVDLRTVISITATTITMDSPPTIAHPTGSIATVGPDGTYGTGWESQYNDQGSDVSVIAQVDSFVRDNDRADGGGRVWLGTYMKSEGLRPADAAHVVAGYWRRGLDTTTALLNESSHLTDPANSGQTTIAVKWASGARVGGSVTVTNGAAGYTGTITSVSGLLIGISPGLNTNYPVNSRVDFVGGGAAVAMKFGQHVNWDAVASNSGRSADPLGVWGPIYGNETGDIWSGTAADGGGDFWYTSNADARIRLRPVSFLVSVPILCGDSVSAAKDLITLGSSISGSFQGTVAFGQTGEYVGFNTATQKYEFYRDFALVYSIPP